MDILKESSKFLKVLRLNKYKLNALYVNMQHAKEGINSKFGLNEANNYRKVIKYQINDAEFKRMYPDTFKYIKEVADGAEFSVSGNWIMAKKQKRKLSKVISKHALLGRTFHELRGGDVSVIWDIIKPKNVVISTNMYDFFTSASNSSFRSCYAIDGSHFNGNIAYMTDEFTFMIYTSSKDLNRKIGRTWGYYINEKTFLTSRVYGSMFELELASAINELSETLDPDNNWNIIAYEYEQFKNARPYEEFPIPVYFDYTHIMVHTSYQCLNPESLPTLRFNLINCLVCGNETIGGYYGMCTDCKDSIYRCQECESIFHCDDESPMNNLCSKCYELKYKSCSRCGGIHYNNDTIEIDGKWLCIDCVCETHHKCNQCGKILGNDEFEQVGKFKICKPCSKTINMCDGCECLWGTNDLETYNDGIYCPHCHDELTRLAPSEDGYLWYNGNINVAELINDTLIIRNTSTRITRTLEQVNNATGGFVQLSEIYPYLKRELRRNDTTYVESLASWGNTTAGIFTVGQSLDITTNIPMEYIPEQPVRHRTIIN